MLTKFDGMMLGALSMVGAAVIGGMILGVSLIMTMFQ